jgi:hypothetical protein
MANDPNTKAIHADAAAAYDSLALEIDKTAKRIADIDRTTTKARAKNSVLPKSQLSQDAPELAPDLQDPEHKA